MKKLLLILLLLNLQAFALEPIKVIDPKDGTKVEITLNSPAKEFRGNIEVVKGMSNFDLVLCNESGLELKRTKIDNFGEYNFGALEKGRYYLKFENIVKPKTQKQDKAAPYIVDIPYHRKK